MSKEDAKPASSILPADDSIVVRGACENNLANVDCAIPRRKLTVVTGPSGSGKSSLVFGVLWREARRRASRMLELPRQARGERIPPAKVAALSGLACAIALEQKPVRSRFATAALLAGVYWPAARLFELCGKAHCVRCGAALEHLRLSRAMERLAGNPAGTRLVVQAVVEELDRERSGKRREDLVRAGFTRAMIAGNRIDLAAPGEGSNCLLGRSTVAIDALTLREDNIARLSEALELANRFGEGSIELEIRRPDEPEKSVFAFHTVPKCSACRSIQRGIAVESFRFWKPSGACPACGGTGVEYRLREDVVFGGRLGSVQETLREVSREYHLRLAADDCRRWCERAGVDPQANWIDLSRQQLDALFLRAGPGRREPAAGGERAEVTPDALGGLIDCFDDVARNGGSHQVRRRAAAALIPAACSSCSGARLAPEPLALSWNGKTFLEFLGSEVSTVLPWLQAVSTNLPEEARRMKGALEDSLRALSDLGLGYLPLSQGAATLSSGEIQRIALARALRSGLSEVVYLLDEPTCGLHPGDIERLAAKLRELVAAGNTAVVVEHDPQIARASDYCLALGPGAGAQGGRIVAAGSPDEVLESAESNPVPAKQKQPPRTSGTSWLTVRGACKNNLKSLTVAIPLGELVAVCGVSGSGKSSLMRQCVAPALEALILRQRRRGGSSIVLSAEERAAFGVESIEGWESLSGVANVAEAGRAALHRSTAASVLGIPAVLRELYAKLPEAKIRGMSAKDFLRQTAGAACPECRGRGWSPLSGREFPCFRCDGSGYNEAIAAITYRGRSLAETLGLTIEEAGAEFRRVPMLTRVLSLATEFGLGYLKLVQPAATLSLGELQRLHLVKHLASKGGGKRLFVLDEPTRGMHFREIDLLMAMLRRLVLRGHSVAVIEHNPLVIRAADCILELGPEAGVAGGRLLAFGTPEEIAHHPSSRIGKFL